MSFDVYRRDRAPPPDDAPTGDPNNFDVYKKTSPASAVGPQVGYAEDTAKGFAGGLGRGAAGLAGLPGDISEYGARGLDWATRKVGSALGYDIAPRQAQEPSYGSAAARRNLESVTGPLYEPKYLPGQVASTIGEYAPAALFPGTAAARAVNTVVPALASESAGQLTKGTAAEPWARGIAGVAGGVGAAKAITPAAATSPARQAAVAALERENIPLTAGQRTGSKPIQWAESTASDMPGSAGRAAEINAAQRAAYDRALTERTFDRGQLTQRGIPADVNLPDPGVAAAGKQSLSDRYKQIVGQHDLISDQRLVSGIYGRVAEYESRALTPTNELARMRDKITDVLVQNQGSMPGTRYQDFRSQLGTAAKDTIGDTAKKDALRGMRRDLDAAMERSLPADKAAQLRENNRRYANMKTLEGAVAKADENLSPQAVASAVRARRGGEYSQRQGNLDELAHAGNMILKPLPQSGTAPRSMMQSLFNIPTMVASGGGGIIGGIPGAIIGAAAPMAAARSVLSRPGQAYLGNRALPQNTRDVVAQTLAQQAISQPGVIERNRREREEYEKKRKARQR